MEEYSTDDEEKEEEKKLNPDPMPVMDPVSTCWWMFVTINIGQC